MLEDLKHKERTVKDLATFINNRPGEYKQALYCMLIGAGASVTSGIRTGQDLIKVWRKQVLKKYDPNIDIENLNDDEIKSKIYKFYNESDKENEYSALFGKIYDLKAQRRNFIEQEVAKAISPSIGYQYLNILAEEKYIQTFFTTNFDDLLELALSPLNSKNRPVVCAQDSSVSNISITSQRTKIIKLHGDFLYNDLRSSKDETESLEKNMEEKFTEFLKNYGLIVLGYAGNDKSIMDCLFNLLGSKEKKDSKVKKDVQNNYLNNGLYWCITRKDYENNNISTKVLDLLTEEKVYYVIIDGFDEFCAELTHELYSVNSKGNVLFNKSHERQYQELEEYYKMQKEKFQHNLLILNDIKNCMSESPSNGDVTKTTTEFSSNTKNFEDNNEKQSEVDNAVTKDIKKLINQKNYNEALSLIDNEILNNKLPSFLQNYYNLLKIECQVSLKQVDEALKTIDEAIIYNDKNKKDSNVQLYYEKSLLAKNRNERIKSIRAAIDIDKYSYNLWNRLAEELIDNEYEYSKNKAEILECYKKSIELNDASDNDAYIDRILFLKDETDENNQELIDVCDETIKILQDKDPYSTAYIKANFEKIESQIKYSKGHDITSLKQQAKEIFNKTIQNNKNYERNLFYIDMFLTFCSKQCDLEELKSLFLAYDDKYYNDILYIIQKAKIYLKNFRNLSYAISILENIDLNILKYSIKDRDRYYHLYIKYLLYDNQYEKAYKVYNENVTQNMRKARTLESDILFKIDKDKYIEHINKEFNESTKNTQDLITYTYGLLNIKEYDKIYDLCKVLLQPNNTEIDSNNPILQINYNMAKKYGSKQSKINQTNLEQIFKIKNDSFVKAAGYMLLDDLNNAEKIFKKELPKNYDNFYSYQKMPIFNQLNFDKLKLEPISKI